jgi:hypothetical protein
MAKVAVVGQKMYGSEAHHRMKPSPMRAGGRDPVEPNPQAQSARVQQQQAEDADLICRCDAGNQ